MVASSNEAVEVRLDHVERDVDSIWKTLEKVRNRPPWWCTFLLAAMTGALGSLLATVFGGN